VGAGALAHIFQHIGSGRGGAAQARGLCWVRRKAGLSQGQQALLVDGADVCGVAAGGNLDVLQWAQDTTARGVR